MAIACNKAVTSYPFLLPFDSLAAPVSEITNSPAVVVVVENVHLKDLKSQRVVSIERAQEFAASISAILMDTSAKENFGKFKFSL